MSDSMKTIYDYPDISFIGEYAVDGQKKLLNQMIDWFLEKRKEVTGETITLGEADERRLMIQVAAYYLFHGFEMVDSAGKMNLLKYSIGGFLENLGTFKGITRLPAAAATVTLRFSINEPRENAITIPRGSRATAGDGVFFSTTEYMEIEAGNLYVDVPAVCSKTGTSGNIYQAGEIKAMETRIPFVDAVSNVTPSANGRDIETDEELRERIFLAPDAYSTAGSEDSYKFHARKYDPAMADIQVTAPSAGKISIKVLTAGGEIPNEEYIGGLQKYISDPAIKPLTDEITVSAPDQMQFDVNLTYYIGKSDTSKAETIQKTIDAAISSYIKWQQSAIGRDINPDELIKFIKNAGAKRVVITSPEYEVVKAGYCARLRTKSVTYGGLEDD